MPDSETRKRLQIAKPITRCQTLRRDLALDSFDEAGWLYVAAAEEIDR